MNWLARFITERPKLVLLIFSLITLVMVAGVVNVKFRFSIRALYDYPGNELVKVQDRYFDDFGDDIGFVTAIIEADDIFTPPILSYIQQLSRKLKRKPIYRRIWSLAVNQLPRGHGNEVITGPLFEQVPTDPARLRQIREVALQSRLAVPRLVSKDGRFALVAAELREPSPRLTTVEQEKAIATLNEVLASTPKPAGVQLYTGGSPIIECEIRNMMVSEQLKFGSVALVLITLVLLLAFGSFHSVLLTFAEVLLTLTWALGFMGFAGIEINMFSNTAPTILMIYGLLDSLFIVAVFYKVFDEEGDRKKAARITIQRMGWACFITSVSTAIGFIGFTVTKIAVMQELGLTLAIGVLIAFLSSIVWMPAILCVIPAPRRGYKKRRFFALISSALTHVGHLTSRRRWPIFVGALVIFVAAAAITVTKSRISVLYLKELPQNTPGMKGVNLLGEHLLGAISTVLTVDGEPDAMQDPKVIQALDKLDRWAEQQSIVKSSLSPSDIVRELHRAFNGGDPAFDKVPDDRGLIAQYLAILDPHTRGDFITDDYARTHLRIITRDVGSFEWRRDLVVPLMVRANKLLKDYKLELTGYARAAFEGQEELVVQLLWGFVLGFSAIALLVAIAFRSPRLAALALVPNLLPTVVCLATLAMIGVSLRGPTTLFLCVAVGITFDNTIHLFTAIRDARARGLEHDDAITDALGTVGPPIMYTTLLIAGGFGIFMLSDFGMLKGFGATCVAVVVMAAFADLFFTVSLVRLGGKRAFASRTQKSG